MKRDDSDELISLRMAIAALQARLASIPDTQALAALLLLSELRIVSKEDVAA